MLSLDDIEKTRNFFYGAQQASTESKQNQLFIDYLI